jgi:hypothetical protein
MPNFEESCGAPTTGAIFIVAGWKIIRRPPYRHSEYSKREKLLPVLKMVAVTQPGPTAPTNQVMSNQIYEIINKIALVKYSCFSCNNIDIYDKLKATELGV